MHQGKYDRIYFIGGSLDSYSPGSRACVEIVEQYGEYLATTSDIIFNLSWMSMGQIKIGNIEITIENYWSLLREVCQRTEATDDPFAINSWHVDLPPHYQAIGEQFCEYHNIDLSKPIITLHARNHGYHALAKQEFRNAPIKDYVPAIQYLLDSGYQVVRLGDAKMPKLDIRDRGYFEIPNMAHYENGLDPFFIKRSVFLIGSQSGPCSYARALGIPVLSINAVFSYTLLPAVLEMACFKRYSIRDDNGAERFLNYEEILDRDIFKIESQFQFERQGISFTNCTSQEIIAAVKDMLEWVVCPEMALSPEQDTFKRLTMQTSARLKNATDTNPAIADYLGIALPGYRISTTVEKLRAAPITSAEPTGNAA
jgi:putative glycosyltransferase (TIGR04372 family)